MINSKRFLAKRTINKSCITKHQQINNTIARTVEDCAIICELGNANKSDTKPAATLAQATHQLSI